jgi:hypothetical protein
MTLVSIVTPSYNQAAFLEQTIQSVLQQDGVQLEYCVVDGASTDESPAIIRRYAHRLAWWVSEPDRGQAEAINKGFRRATGEVIAWLNSDDIYLPGAIQRAVAVLEANPALGMVYGDALSIDETGRPVNKLAFRNWSLVDLLSFRIICQPAVFMRRAVLEQAGYLDLDYHFMLDHHLWIRMARLAPIQHIPHVLAAARQHAGAKNVKQAAGFSRETQRSLEWMQTQLDLAPLFRQHKRTILGGAYRLEARYYLDGDQPGEALRYYSKALVNSPAYALKHWHRIAYAALALVGLQKSADRILRPVSARQKLLSLPPEIQVIQNWPGLKL